MSQLDRLDLGNQAPPSEEWLKNLDKALDKWAQALVLLLKNGLRFEDNNDIDLVTFTTHATPGTEVAVAHTLKNRVPNGFLVYGKDKAGHLYDGTTAFSSANIYVRSDVASVTAKIMIF